MTHLQLTKVNQLPAPLQHTRTIIDFKDLLNIIKHGMRESINNKTVEVYKAKWIYSKPYYG